MEKGAVVSAEPEESPQKLINIVRGNGRSTTGGEKEGLGLWVLSGFKKLIRTRGQSTSR